MRKLPRVASVAMCVFVAGIALGASPRAIGRSQQNPPTPPMPIVVPPQTPAGPQAPVSDYAFPSGSGMFFFYVKPEKATDFEAVVAKVSDVLSKTQDPARKQQAANWRIYRSTETPREGAIYVFLFDPAVVGADYDPVRVLGEGLPAEVQGLYDRLKDALIRVERMGLAKLR
jgi:hypothetical protein